MAFGEGCMEEKETAPWQPSRRSPLIDEATVTQGVSASVPPATERTQMRGKHSNRSNARTESARQTFGFN